VWSAQAAYPTNIMDHAVTSHRMTDGSVDVYAIGGITASGVNATNSYRYDTTANTWSTIAPMPVLAQGLGAASDGTYIYIVNGVSSSVVLNKLHRYDPVANTYMTLTAPTEATWNHATVYLNGDIYRIGGAGAVTPTITGTTGVEVYDIAAGTWSNAAPLPIALRFPMAVAMNGFVYVAGGLQSSDGSGIGSTKTYRYDPNTNTWADGGISDLPSGRWAGASGIKLVDQFNRWILAGGASGGFITNTAISYNPLTDAWTPLDPMPLGRYRLQGTGAGTNFYAVGGASGGFTTTNANQRYRNTCSAFLVGHVRWEDNPPPNAPQPSPLQVLPFTITLKLGSTEINFPHQYTDESGFFTVSTKLLPAGNYTYRINGYPPVAGDGPGFLANVGPVSITPGSTTNLEIGLMKGGDADYSNVGTATGVDVVDFNILKNTFGCAPGSCNLRANFAQDAGPAVVDVSDFNTLKRNFGILVPGPIRPEGEGVSAPVQSEQNRASTEMSQK
jgi:N-acetylneuraminic acid mutarotase